MQLSTSGGTGAGSSIAPVEDEVKIVTSESHGIEESSKMRNLVTKPKQLLQRNPSVSVMALNLGSCEMMFVLSYKVAEFMLGDQTRFTR